MKLDASDYKKSKELNDKLIILCKKLCNESQKLKQPTKEFTNYLRGYDSKVYTQEDINNIVKKYIDSQIEKKRLMRRFSDKLNTIKNIKYYKKEGNNVFKKTFGIDKIIEANTKMGRKKIDNSILYALQDGEDGKGFFVPDDVLNVSNIMTILKFLALRFILIFENVNYIPLFNIYKIRVINPTHFANS